MVAHLFCDIMCDYSLVEIKIDDIKQLDNSQYRNLSEDKRVELVENSQNEELRGNYFKFYLIKDELNEVIGFLNVFGHKDNSVSVAPEIIEKYKNKGIAYKVLAKVYNELREKGVNKLIADINSQNVPSIKLHEKLGFRLVRTYLNKNGKEMNYYEKNL